MLFTQITQKKGKGQLDMRDKCACATMCVHYISIDDGKWLRDWCQIGAVNMTIIGYCSLVVVCALCLCMHIVVEGLVFNSPLL